MFETGDGEPRHPSGNDREAAERRPAKTPTPARIVRHMPADLRQRRFGAGLRGFDRGEVLLFLTEVADDFEQALHEIHALQREVERLEDLLLDHRSREHTLRDTLLTAQRMSDEIRSTARSEAQEIVRDSEQRADLLIEKARTRLADVEREIEHLRTRRRQTEVEIEDSIKSMQHTLDEVRAQKDRDDRVRFMPPRTRSPESPEGVEPGADDEPELRLRDGQS